jgi:hypothetical protein
MLEDVSSPNWGLYGFLGKIFPQSWLLILKHASLEAFVQLWISALRH